MRCRLSRSQRNAYRKLSRHGPVTPAFAFNGIGGQRYEEPPACIDAGVGRLKLGHLDKSGEKYFGKIVWLQSTVDNKPMVDANNPDEKKRNQPIIGLIMLKSFEFDDDEWDDGTIYDPENGKTYSCHLTLKDINTLRVRGYIGIPLFGRTEIWTRSKL